MFKWRRKSIKVSSSNPDKENIKNLSNKGITKIAYNFTKFADYINKNCINPLLSNKETNIKTYKAAQIDKSKGLTLSRYLTLNDAKILNFITSQEISNIIYPLDSEHYSVIGSEFQHDGIY